MSNIIDNVKPDHGSFKIPKQRTPPPSFPEFKDEHKGSAVLSEAMERNVAWVLLGAVGDNCLEKQYPQVDRDELGPVGSWTSFMKSVTNCSTMKCKLEYPISTLPEHLHSTFPSHAKLPENTLTEKKNIPFPSLTLITCLTGPPVTPPPFTGRPSHTLSYTTILFLALKVNGRFLESLPVFTFASLELKLPVFSFH